MRPFTRAHHAQQIWEVKSLTTNSDSTVAIVSATRTDTIHYAHESWGPSIPGIDTIYTHVDTVSFPIVITSASIISKWTIALPTGPWESLETIPRYRVGSTFLTSPGNVQASYASDTGLTKYTGSAAANFWWADTLSLIGLLKK